MRTARATIADRDVRTGRLWTRVLDVCAGLATDEPAAVMAFVGVGNEPDTSGLTARLSAAGHRVMLPRVEGDHIVPVLHQPGTELRSGAYGIPEPTGDAVAPDTIDLVIVPGLAFTDDGLRLGQGGGFYDRFLPLVRDDCVTCGVAFAEQIVESLPLEAHDRRLRLVVSA